MSYAGIGFYEYGFYEYGMDTFDMPPSAPRPDSVAVPDAGADGLDEAHSAALAAAPQLIDYEEASDEQQLSGSIGPETASPAAAGSRATREWAGSVVGEGEEPSSWPFPPAQQLDPPAADATMHASGGGNQDNAGQPAAEAPAAPAPRRSTDVAPGTDEEPSTRRLVGVSSQSQELRSSADSVTFADAFCAGGSELHAEAGSASISEKQAEGEDKAAEWLAASALPTASMPLPAATGIPADEPVPAAAVSMDNSLDGASGLDEAAAAGEAASRADLLSSTSGVDGDTSGSVPMTRLSGSHELMRFSGSNGGGGDSGAGGDGVDGGSSDAHLWGGAGAVSAAQTGRPVGYGAKWQAASSIPATEAAGSVDDPTSVAAADAAAAENEPSGMLGFQQPGEAVDVSGKTQPEYCC